MSGFDMVWGAWNDCNMVKVKMANLIVIMKRYLKISLVRTPFSLNFLCENAVPMRSRPTTPLHFYIKIYRMLETFLRISYNTNYLSYQHDKY